MLKYRFIFFMICLGLFSHHILFAQQGRVDPDSLFQVSLCHQNLKYKLPKDYYVSHYPVSVKDYPLLFDMIFLSADSKWVSPDSCFMVYARIFREVDESKLPKDLINLVTAINTVNGIKKYPSIKDRDLDILTSYTKRSDSLNIQYFTGEDARWMFNADTVITYPLPLPDGSKLYKERYKHVRYFYVSRANYGMFRLVAFFTEEDKNMWNKHRATLEQILRFKD